MTADDEGARSFHYVLEGAHRLLVVDDDPIAREFSAVYLATPEVSIDTADSGEAALDLLAKQTYDLAITDLDMPGMGGFELIRRIRSMPSMADLPVIVVTGREDIASIDRAYEAGATSFAIKPVNWRLMSYQVRFVLRAARMAKAAAQARL